MAKVLVFQHVAAEPLGTLDPMLRDRGHRIRYVNFHRNPDAKPDIGRYNALIVLGGPQMPDQGNRYPHLFEEMRCIEEALKRDIPVLGICLGAQLLAYTLGGGVRPMNKWEIGWHDLKPTPQAAADPLFCALVRPHPVFHWHVDERLINRWLSLPEYLEDLTTNCHRGDAEIIRRQTHELIGQSADLSFEIFGQFLRPLGERRSRHVLPSR